MLSAIGQLRIYIKEIPLMRQAQREIKDIAEMTELLDRCQVLRLALHDGEYPYIVPLSFGREIVDGRLFIYFHCAKQGKKVDLIARNNAVAAEVDILDGYVKTEHGVTADYKSVIIYGRAERVCGDEAIHGIELLLEHCGINGYSAEACVKTDAVAVYKIAVSEMTGKRRFK